MAKISKSHSLGKEIAKSKIESLVPQLAEKFNLKYRWVNDYTVSFEGSGAKGQFVITDNSVEGEITLGFLLKAFEGKIVSSVQEKLNEILG
ncbi:MAG: polyhydroxyalkanoic acid system family protein [Deltaproteobacteria bacterium]|nr:polyhydroxyalkanoic acid system family protein [Deltaproteobacteria bacterium]